MTMYTCENCKRKFDKIRSDEEAMAECRKNFSPLEIEQSGGLAILCDDCYEAFMEYMRAHPETRLN